VNPSLITVAVLDRKPADLARLTSTLEDAGYRVLPASAEAQIERYASEGSVNLVVKGYEAGKVDALAFMLRIRALSPDTEFILCGSGGTIQDAVAALRQGACDYLTKPISAELLIEAVRRALERQSLVADDPKLRASLRPQAAPDVFAGTSTAMRAIGETLQTVAPTDVPVLITGESGTGKELVARALHQRGARCNGPFIAINCAGLPDNLIESELFGHVRGAFTGAIADRPGAFQSAAGGTLFLDEIGDLSPKGQGDLLRVLEDGLFRPVGGTRPLRADVRIVAATNRDLSTFANAGRFREDLLYRLNIVEIHLVPLRERTEDIPALAVAFNNHFSARHGRRRKHLSPGFLTALSRHPWPGNVRQLRNLMERLVVTVRDPELRKEHAPEPPSSSSIAVASKGGAVSPTNKQPLFTVSAGMSLAEMEAQLIRETLTRVTPNRAEAAHILGLSPRALAYKLKALGLGRRTGDV
jgi:DNA-binding NtrC family response regulator